MRFVFWVARSVSVQMTRPIFAPYKLTKRFKSIKGRLFQCHQAIRDQFNYLQQEIEGSFSCSLENNRMCGRPDKLCHTIQE